MNRPLILTFAAVGALVMGVALVPWTVSSRHLRDEIVRQITRTTGVVAVTGGEATFALLPSPRIKLEGVRFGSPGQGPVLEVAVVRGDLRLLPLLAGRLELVDLALADPVLRLGADWPEEAGASVQVARAAEMLFAAPASRGRVGQISVSGGRIEQVSPQGTVTIIVSDLDGQLTARAAPARPAPTPTGAAPADPPSSPGAPMSATASPATDSPAAESASKSAPAATSAPMAAPVTAATMIDLSGSFRWRGRAVDLAASGLDPAGYVASRQTPIKLSVSSDLLTARLDGVASGPRLQIDGDLRASSPDLVALGGWLGFDPPWTITGKVDIDGNVRLDADSLAMSGARITLDGQRLDGSLLTRLDGGRLSLSGTLASSRLDFTPLKSALMPPRAQDGGWSREPFDLWRLPRADFDLRLSVGSLVIGGLTLDNAALALLARAGKTDISLAGADFYQGTLNGKLALSTGAQGAVEVRAQASLDQADFGPVLGLLIAGRRLAGTGSGSLQLEGSGDSMAGLMRSWRGKASVKVDQGELVGVNLPEALRRVERRPLVAGLDLIGGRTPFDSATAGFRIADGVAHTSDAQIKSPAARISLAGEIGIGERALHLAGVVSQAFADEGKEAMTLPFVIEGSFDQPQLSPDARDLIRRSGAAAPFLQGGGKDGAGWNAPAPPAPLPR
jgi:AsmA protein